MPTTTTGPEVRLYARLQAIAEYVRSTPFAKYAISGRDFGARDLQAVAESEAFLAFIDLGGDPDHPERFDWDGRETELKVLSRRRFRRAYQSRGTANADHRRRERERKECPLHRVWDAWADADPAADNRPEQGRPALLMRMLNEPQPEREFHRMRLRELPALLTSHLGERDLELIRAHYLEGRRQRDMIPGYRDMAPAEQRRAETRLNVAIHRARRRAKALLSGTEWELLAHEAAAA